VFHTENRKRASLTEIKYLTDEFFLLQVRFRGNLHVMVYQLEERLPVSAAPVRHSGEVERHVLQGAEAKLPRCSRFQNIPVIKLEA